MEQKPGLMRPLDVNVDFKDIYDALMASVTNAIDRRFRSAPKIFPKRPERHYRQKGAQSDEFALNLGAKS
jgi:hypothetical protein